MTIWKNTLTEFEHFMQLEKSLSDNSIESYSRDIGKLIAFFSEKMPEILPPNVELAHLQDFLYWINVTSELCSNSQARLVSAIKGFFKFLYMEDRITHNPASLLSTPRTRRKLPTVLTVEEIDQMIVAIDLSKPEGHRNKAIIETLYSCGLRVSELINLKITNLFFSDQYIKVVGKGNKERLVPISQRAIDYITLYTDHSRKLTSPKKGFENNVFLNRRGKQLTREMVFLIVKETANIAQISKNISPHSLRHSFATHLVEGVANLRVVQDMLGHESITTTEIYTHLDQDYIRSEILSFHPRAIQSRQKKYIEKLNYS